MANVFAIHSVGNSIVTYLRNSYPQALAGLEMPDCAFELVSSGELAGEPGDATRITLYLYRITVNEHSRQVHAASAATARPTPLGLDLHFLLSAWAGNARDEHTIVAWAIRQLHMFPILDASSLSPEAGVFERTTKAWVHERTPGRGSSREADYAWLKLWQDNGAYDWEAPPAERAAAVARWQSWLENNSG